MVPAAGSDVCRTDKVRPAGQSPGPDGLASDSVALRYAYQRGQKQSFYGKWSEVNGLSFVKDLKELSANGPDVKTPNLVGKIAVIHIYGNGFGGIQGNCKRKEELQAWDQFIRVWLLWNDGVGV